MYANHVRNVEDFLCLVIVREKHNTGIRHEIWRVTRYRLRLSRIPGPLGQVREPLDLPGKFERHRGGLETS